MSVGFEYPHIESVKGQPARLRRLPRIRVAQIVMDYLAYGWSSNEMCRQHRYLRPAEAYASLAYYFDHQEELDAEIKEEWERSERERSAAPPSPFLVRMRAKGLL